MRNLKLPGIAALLPLLLSVILFWLWSGPWFERDALNTLRADATLVAQQQVRLAESEMTKFRLLPAVLKQFDELPDALAQRHGRNVDALNAKLEFVAREIGSPIIYLIAPDGVVVASSNARASDSFVGSNFNFRPYFNEALTLGRAQYYATGNLSGRFGLFFAERIGDRSNPIGIVVVKFEFHRLIENWTSDRGESFVVDPHGIILAATARSEDLLTLRELPPATVSDLKKSGQFKGGALTPSRYHPEPQGLVKAPDGQIFASVDVAIAGTDFKLMHIERLGPALKMARGRAMFAALIFLLVVTLASVVLYWRVTRAGRIAADRRALEAAVAARTAELSAEMAERKRSEEHLRDARDALAQANRLATLGSITAGLVHEVNQPVATMRTLSENAQHHLAKGRLDRVTANLASLVELTARIGLITQEMRRFARRGRGALTMVRIGEVIDNAVMLMGERLQQVQLRRQLAGLAETMVQADQVRLEQVLVNLLQNAADAVADCPEPTIEIRLATEGEYLSLTIADNGRGVDPQLASEIFNPFVTGKADGLGLGLSIARDIMNELNGTLHIVSNISRGAAFELRLRRGNE